MSLADYLAKNYLTPDIDTSKTSKKRKRKAADSGLTIADDDAIGWDKGGVGNEDDDRPMITETKAEQFRRAKKSTWQTIGAPAPSSADQAAADAILASAAAESAARTQATQDEDAPTIAEGSDVKMESGAHAGLQSADAVTAQLERRKKEERKRFLEDGDAHSGKNAETIYRDASGRIINVAMARAEARKKAEEENRKKIEEEDAAKGDVQLRERDRRREELKEAKFMTVARSADDVDMNEELKGRERWNDPMARYIEKEGGVNGVKGGKQTKSISGKPLYKGAAAPNRYGIRPGHRWDGVDRGNGFEGDWFKARNKQSSLRDLEYQWQMDE